MIAVVHDERIPTSRILMYSAPMLGVFAANTLLNFYFLKFSTDVLLVAPALIGTVLLAARVWDAVTDPAAGWLSDHTRSRLGRRRPWLLGSALPFGLSVYMLWSPPESLSSGQLSVWVGLAIFLFYTAYTAFRVPHMALGAELSRGYHDRTRVFGISQAFESLGMFVAAGALFFLENAEAPREFARMLSIGIGVFACVLIVLASLRLRERAEFQGRSGKSPMGTFRDVLKNPHALMLMGAIFMEQLGFAALVALLPYISDYVILTPGDTAIYLFGAVGSLLLSIPVWIAISRRIGKKQVWLWSIAAKIAIFAAMFTLGEGDGLGMAILSALFGAMQGCGSVVAPSLKADVVDWDEARTGERKEGAYFATWNFMQKAAAGVALWAIGLMLSWTGFVPNEPQSDATIQGMRFLVAGAPLLLHVVAFALVAKFGLSETEHRAALAQTRSRPQPGR